MRWTGLGAACAVGLLAATVAATEQDDLPAPWFRTGDVAPANQCRVFVEQAKSASFDKNLVMRCDGSRSSFVTVMQQISAEDFRGKRVRLAADVRGDGVRQWAGLWMRVDGELGKVLAFDNMQSRAFKGTFGWQSASVVLDVPAEAKVIAFGVLQRGDGTTYTGGIDVKVVGTDVASTAMPAVQSMSKTPGNLSFNR